MSDEHEHRDPSGSHTLHREDTGSHRAQHPPSDPPLSKRGPSWGALAAVCALLLLPSIAALVQLGRVLEQLEQLRADVSPLAERSREHDLHLAVLRRDHDALERDFGKMERRRRESEDR